MKSSSPLAQVKKTFPRWTIPGPLTCDGAPGSCWTWTTRLRSKGTRRSPVVWRLGNFWELMYIDSWWIKPPYIYILYIFVICLCFFNTYFSIWVFLINSLHYMFYCHFLSSCLQGRQGIINCYSSFMFCKFRRVFLKLKCLSFCNHHLPACSMVFHWIHHVIFGGLLFSSRRLVHPPNEPGPFHLWWPPAATLRRATRVCAQAGLMSR